jgi:histone deacetylase 1/2
VATETFVEVPLETAKNVIKCKWVFRVKRTPVGAPLFKARLVAKGFSQKEGVDFTETWAPTAKQVTARCVLHLAASKDLELHAMDVDQAFLQGDLNETLYMEPPPGIQTAQLGQVWLLKKPLYGLKQAPRQWHAKLKGVLVEMGLKCSTSDPSLFLSTSFKNAWILVYVDDLLIMAEDSNILQMLKEKLKAKFPLKDLGPVSNYLGMELSRNRGNKEIHLQQTKYIESIQKRFADFPCPAFDTPLLVNHSLTLPATGEEILEGEERYPELVGCLMYLMVCTRPDLAHSLSVLGRFVGPGRHGGKHWKAALRVLGYAVKTRNLKLTLGGVEAVLEGFTDASWADHLDDRRSSQGYCFTLGSGMVSWKATRSSSVALSSCEAELYGGTSAAQELLWLKGLLQELGSPTLQPVLFCDNKSTVAQTRDPVFSAKSKHIEARYFFIRELTQGNQMRTEHVSGEDNPADIFTKALLRERHNKMLQLLGLK